MTVPHSVEQNAQILYDFATSTVLPLLKADGIWIGPDPWPLPPEIIEREFKRIAEHESYDSQTVVCKTESGKYVRLTHGEVTVFDTPEGLSDGV